MAPEPFEEIDVRLAGETTVRGLLTAICRELVEQLEPRPAPSRA